MKKIITIAMMIVLLCTLLLGLSGCRKSDRVAYNISKEADNFNVVRRLTVINARTDTPLFELIGRFSISNNSADELVVTCQTSSNEFKKHYVYVNREWTLYVIEDVSGADVAPYHYEINFIPEMIVQFEFELGES